MLINYSRDAKWNRWIPLQNFPNMHNNNIASNISTNLHWYPTEEKPGAVVAAGVDAANLRAQTLPSSEPCDKSNCCELTPFADWYPWWGSTFWGQSRGWPYYPTRCPRGGRPPPGAPDFPSSGKRGRTIFEACFDILKVVHSTLFIARQTLKWAAREEDATAV
jgi:hypothetical protein